MVTPPRHPLPCTHLLVLSNFELGITFRDRVKENPVGIICSDLHAAQLLLLPTSIRISLSSCFLRKMLRSAHSRWAGEMERVSYIIKECLELVSVKGVMDRRVESLCNDRELAADYANREPLIIGTLNGAFIFMAGG